MPPITSDWSRSAQAQLSEPTHTPEADSFLIAGICTTPATGGCKIQVNMSQCSHVIGEINNTE